MINDNTAWELLLNKFKQIVNSSKSEKLKKEALEQLRNVISQETTLSNHQSAAINDRINNYLNGTYGQSKALIVMSDYDIGRTDKQSKIKKNG